MAEKELKGKSEGAYGLLGYRNVCADEGVSSMPNKLAATRPAAVSLGGLPMPAARFCSVSHVRTGNREYGSDVLPISTKMKPREIILSQRSGLSLVSDFANPIGCSGQA